MAFKLYLDYLISYFFFFFTFFFVAFFLAAFFFAFFFARALVSGVFSLFRIVSAIKYVPERKIFLQ